jgi:hypothetical protein
MLIPGMLKIGRVQTYAVGARYSSTADALSWVDGAPSW